MYEYVSERESGKVQPTCNNQETLGNYNVHAPETIRLLLVLGMYSYRTRTRVSCRSRAQKSGDISERFTCQMYAKSWKAKKWSLLLP